MKDKNMLRKFCIYLFIFSLVLVNVPRAVSQEGSKEIYFPVSGQVVWSDDSQKFYFETQSNEWYEYQIEQEVMTKIEQNPLELDDTISQLAALNPLLPQDDNVPLIYYSPNKEFVVYALNDLNEDGLASVALANLASQETITILTGVYPYKEWMFHVYWSEDSSAFMLIAKQFNFSFSYASNFSTNIENTQILSANDLELRSSEYFIDEVGVVYDTFDINENGDNVLLGSTAGLVIWKPENNTATIFEVDDIEDAAFIDNETILYVDDNLDLYQIDVETENIQLVTNIFPNREPSSETFSFSPNGCYLLSWDVGYYQTPDTLYLTNVCALAGIETIAGLLPSGAILPPK